MCLAQFLDTIILETWLLNLNVFTSSILQASTSMHSALTHKHTRAHNPPPAAPASPIMIFCYKHVQLMVLSQPWPLTLTTPFLFGGPVGNSL